VSGTRQEGPGGIVRTADASDFRETIPTADARGRRIWIYPRQPRGAYYRARSWVSYALLLILFAGPFIRINGNPLLMMNLVERKFSIFGQMFYPQDMFLFAVGMIAVFIFIVLATAVFGRLWCGWLCPQTVLMEMVFRKIEYWIEGDGPDQQALNRAPWTTQKLAKKLTKHAVFFALSFVIGNLLLAYIIGSDALLEIITDPPREHLAGLAFMVLFSLLFYGIFARFREQACTFICPYGRFQSVLLDERSLVVAYDWKRGDPRGRHPRGLSLDTRRAGGRGDCIDCHLCVAVCPTGIDIRNGTQMECVNCTACIDACNGVMQKLGFPPGLIRFASLNGIAAGETWRFTARTGAYCLVLAGLVGFLTVMVATRSEVDATFLRAPGPLFQTMPDGRISNLYLVRAVNKSDTPLPLSLRMLSPAEGAVTLAGGTLTAPPQESAESAAIVTLPRDSLTDGSHPIEIGLFHQDRLLHTFSSNFAGPGAGASTGPTP
jgi:cytochrome c oxidase accessory protein FixG